CFFDTAGDYSAFEQLYLGRVSNSIKRDRSRVRIARGGNVSRQTGADNVGEGVESTNLKVSVSVGRGRAAARGVAITARAHDCIRERLPILIHNVTGHCAF